METGKMKLIIAIIILIHIVFLINLRPVCAQYERTYSTKSKKAIKLYQTAESYIARRQFFEAVNLLNQAIKKDKDFVEAYLQEAFCYKILNNVEKQKKYLESVLGIVKDPSHYKNVFYSLGEASYLLMQYDTAIYYLNRFLDFPRANPQIVPEARWLLSNAEFAREHIKKPVRFNPEILPPVINSGPLQYFPVLTADEKKIFFTKRTSHQPQFDEDIYVAEKDSMENWETPYPISRNINTPHNEGTCTISADGKILIFTCCMGRGGYGSCDLYISYEEGNDWSRPVNMGENINSSSWDSQPSLSADGRKLYFISDRPGGQGGRDIWLSYTDEKGNWQPCINLGPAINTKKDEVSPFIHVNGQTLYFASKGYPGFGGYDLYSAEYINGVWSKPKNLGFPVNTPEDQVSLFVTANGKKGYYSLDSYTDNGLPTSNIYCFDIPEEISVRNKSYYVQGKILDAETHEPLKARIDLMDVNKNDLVSRVYSDSIFGEYTMVLTEGSEYALYVDCPGYIFESRNFNLPKGSPYKPVQMDFYLNKSRAGAVTTLNNIFFDTDKYDLKEKSITELERIIGYMQRFPEMKIEILGHTDDVGTAEYNLKLSIKRAEAVYDYLVDHGINPDRLDYKGFGQAKPAFPNDSEVNRSRNRRIEFMILDI